MDYRLTGLANPVNRIYFRESCYTISKMFVVLQTHVGTHISLSHKLFWYTGQTCKIDCKAYNLISFKCIHDFQSVFKSAVFITQQKDGNSTRV